MAWTSSWGTTPHNTDTVNTLLKRIASSASGGGGGGGVASGNLNGSGSPLGVVTPAAINQQYRDDDTDNYWWATGLTSADWTPVV